MYGPLLGRFPLRTQAEIGTLCSVRKLEVRRAHEISALGSSGGKSVRGWVHRPYFTLLPPTEQKSG
ncbi:uncharacterized protein METZ01_LOCUS479227, partial [marine metagenome]